MTAGPADAAAEAAAPPLNSPDIPDTGIVGRITGILRRPRATFRAVVRAPRWAGLLIVLTSLTAAANAALLSTAVGQQALVDQWERTALAFGQPVDDARYAEFQALSERGPVYGVLTSLAGIALATVVVAGAIYGVGRMLGLRGPVSGAPAAVSGSAAPTFQAVLAVVTHAGVILALRQWVAAPINYARETLASPGSMTLFFTMVDEASPVARFFGVLDIFVVWWTVLLAIGTSVLYAVPARRVLVWFLGAYVGLAMLLAATMAVLGGTQ